MEERRTLCPTCGSRPRRIVRVMRSGELVQETWWCRQCASLIERMPDLFPGTKVDLHVDLASMVAGRMN